MSTFVISDIHGQYDMFMEILEKINLKESDTLYVLGDILDRGPHPIKTLLKIMEMPNVICLVGNHEYMAVECLSFLRKEVTDRSLEELDLHTLENLVTWQYNGAKSTIDEFRELDSEMQDEVIEFIKDFSLYEEININGKNFLLIHAGLGNFSPDKKIEDYSLYDLVWKRAEYEKNYYEKTIVITGHTPTQFIEENPRKGFIYKGNNHLAIDCGAYLEDGKLACVCLETEEEFYSSPNKNIDENV